MGWETLPPKYDNDVGNWKLEGDPPEYEKVGVLKSDVIYCLTEQIKELEKENERLKELLKQFQVASDRDVAHRKP